MLAIVSSRPSIIDEVPPNSDAFAAGRLPATAGEGVAKALVNDHPVSGKLVSSRTASAVDHPIYISDDIHFPIYRLLGRCAGRSARQ